jgi:hypothetical protein
MTEIELPEFEELEEMKNKSFSRRVALVTAIYAVMLALASLGGNNATKEMLLAQQQASDQWSFYQSKVMREQIYKIQKMRMQLDLLERGSLMKDAIREKYESMLRQLEGEETRYNQEKKEIQEEARKLEHEREVNRSRDPYFDYAEALLQISIVMASISILAVSRPIFYFSIGLASLGAALTLNGYLFIFRLSIFH